MALSVRKKILLSLLYPSVLVCLVLALVVFMVTYVVPNFAQLYSSLSAELPFLTQILIDVGTAARDYIVFGILGFFGAVVGFRLWAQTEAGIEQLEHIRRRLPVIGEVC
jgi:type IV pilus assembly protein PilC